MRITEASFQRTIIDLARLLGWKVAHFRPAQTSQGWRTPVQGDGAGYPDLTLVRDRLIIAELKTNTGKTSPHQAAWLDALHKAGVEAYVWRPCDYNQIERILRDKPSLVNQTLKAYDSLLLGRERNGVAR